MGMEARFVISNCVLMMYTVALRICAKLSLSRVCDACMPVVIVAVVNAQGSLVYAVPLMVPY